MKIPTQLVQKIKGGTVILRSSRCIHASPPRRPEHRAVIVNMESRLQLHRHCGTWLFTAYLGGVGSRVPRESEVDEDFRGGHCTIAIRMVASPK
jgi:hypothetical protein